MKIKKSLISAMMVSAMVLGGTGAVFANGNDSSNIALPKFESLIKSGITDPTELKSMVLSIILMKSMLNIFKN